MSIIDNYRKMDSKANRYNIAERQEANNISIKNLFWQHKKSWEESMKNGLSQDENGDYVPWMTYEAIDFLKKIIKPEWQLFEFGCGASTLFFSQKVKKLVTIETNSLWKNLIDKKNQHKTEIILMLDGINNPEYEKSAINYSTESCCKFDLIIIDSIKRYNCAINSIDAINEEGIIILDDSERKNYNKIFDFFTHHGFKRIDFWGIAPAGLKIKNTSFFTRKI